MDVAARIRNNQFCGHDRATLSVVKLENLCRDNAGGHVHQGLSEVTNKIAV